jgi:ABC-type transport system involved in cytochrome c biogenesis permease subunit
VIQGYTSLLSHYIENRQTEFEEQALALTKILEKQITTKTKVEVIYQRGHFFRWAWMFYLCAALIWWLSRYSQRSLWVTLGLGLTTVGWILHAGGMLLRSYISGRPPVSNMYESMIWVSFGVIFFAGAIYFSQRQRIIFVAATIVSALVLVAADIAPAILDPSIQPLVPVLRSNFWLTIHVLTITLSYAAFALCEDVGNYNLYFFTKNPVPRQTTEQLNQLMYRATQFGVVLLAAGTILGGVWADYSWGRFWGWDPKEVWALIALLGYLIVLHARYTGWMKEYGFALMSVVSFMLVMMAWYGVNFILGAGLHSYGFSQGGQLFVTVVLFFQLVYIGLVEMLRRQRNILEPKQSSGE